MPYIKTRSPYRNCERCGETRLRSDWARGVGGSLKKHCGCGNECGRLLGWTADQRAARLKQQRSETRRRQAERAGRSYIQGGASFAAMQRADPANAHNAHHVKALQQISKRRRIAMLHSAHVKLYRSLSGAEQYRRRYRNNMSFSIKERLRRQLRKKSEAIPGVAELVSGALRRDGASPRVEALLGYSIEQLKSHIERQFTKGMDWSKWGRDGIHIDHILPKKCFDLTTVEGIQTYWSLSNLRPLWKRDNLTKSSKVESLC